MMRPATSSMYWPKPTATIKAMEIEEKERRRARRPLRAAATALCLIFVWTASGCSWLSSDAPGPGTTGNAEMNTVDAEKAAELARAQMVSPDELSKAKNEADTA